MSSAPLWDTAPTHPPPFALSALQGGVCRRLCAHAAAERGGRRDLPGGPPRAACAGEAALDRRLQVCVPVWERLLGCNQRVADVLVAWVWVWGRPPAAVMHILLAPGAA